MELLTSREEDLARAAQALREGKLVAIPTETVYGLGANAFDETALARIFEVKARPTFDPLIVHIASIDDLAKVAARVPPQARKLAEALWPGPLTIILPKRAEVPDLVTSGLHTVAVRFPRNDIARRIIALSGTVVAAPSANPFGYISPTTAQHVVSMLGDKVDFIVDGGACDVGVESTVIDMTGEIPTIVRPGGMTVETIEQVIGPVRIVQKTSGPVVSPGQTLSHYAPRTPLYLFEEESLPRAALALFRDAGQQELPHPSVALVFDRIRARELDAYHVFDAVEVLSPSRTMREAAARLFSLLHEFDARGYAAIFVEKVPEEGLGRAINDRLFRASRK
ncbi:MAG: L-threonylcarbamoyladenylate synthase [Spirochaetales bacterium]|nr:L-threonylcarbamoyladenylate synthase [Spirochaetales bacterium]